MKMPPLPSLKLNNEGSKSLNDLRKDLSDTYLTPILHISDSYYTPGTHQAHTRHMTGRHISCTCHAHAMHTQIMHTEC